VRGNGGSSERRGAAARRAGAGGSEAVAMRIIAGMRKRVAQRLAEEGDWR
jgi:hypothetical protein